MRRHLHLQPRRGDERGVVAVWVALTMIVLAVLVYADDPAVLYARTR
mgnify:CR=1 FL=1